MSTRGRYGVRLMVALAMNWGNGITLLRDVSRREGISVKYLGQIIIPLKNAALVTSQRGSRGGYALGRPPEEITVRDVVEAIEGRIRVAPCVAEPGGGDRSVRETRGECARITSCVATRVWKKLGEDIGASLSSFTLAALAHQARDLDASDADYEI
jgi:Rrf2 family protein